VVHPLVAELAVVVMPCSLHPDALVSRKQRGVVALVTLHQQEQQQLAPDDEDLHDRA
jgi:hypothetical protein